MNRNTYLTVFSVALILAAAVYFVYMNQPRPQASTGSDTAPEQETTIVAKTQIEPEEKAQKLDKGAELQEKITAMKKRQKQRDAQMQAYLQATPAPQRVPDLPTIEPIEMAPSTTGLAQVPDQLDVNSGHILPKEVMDKFTTETGLTQAEIEKAMNR